MRSTTIFSLNFSLAGDTTISKQNNNDVKFYSPLQKLFNCLCIIQLVPPCRDVKAGAICSRAIKMGAICGKAAKIGATCSAEVRKGDAI